MANTSSPSLPAVLPSPDPVDLNRLCLHIASGGLAQPLAVDSHKTAGAARQTAWGVLQHT